MAKNQLNGNYVWRILHQATKVLNHVMTTGLLYCVRNDTLFFSFIVSLAIIGCVAFGDGSNCALLVLAYS